jgi:hypothetical protein
MHTVVETPRYQADAARLFTEEEQASIVDLIASDPRCGVVVPGGGSVRKVRASGSVDAASAAVRESSICSAGMICRFFFWRRLPRTRGMT